MTYLDQLKQIKFETENRKIETSKSTKISAIKLNALKEVKNSILQTIASISSYKNFTGDLPAYQQLLDLSIILRARLDSLNDTLSNLTLNHEKQLDNKYDIDESLMTIYNKIHLMETYNITSDIINTFLLFKDNTIQLNNQTAKFSYIHNPSNIKNTVLFDVPPNDDATYHTYGIAYQLYPNTKRKVHKLINVLFLQSTLYLIVLDLKTKIRKVYSTKDNDSFTNIQLSNYDPSTETFTIAADLPPISRDDLTLTFFNELNKEI
jgi:hypothetical protein